MNARGKLKNLSEISASLCKETNKHDKRRVSEPAGHVHMSSRVVAWERGNPFLLSSLEERYTFLAGYEGERQKSGSIKQKGEGWNKTSELDIHQI